MTLDQTLDQLEQNLSHSHGSLTDLFDELGTFMRDETNRSNPRVKGFIPSIIDYSIKQLNVKNTESLGMVFRFLANFVADSDENRHIVLQDPQSESFFTLIRDNLTSDEYNFFVLHFLNNFVLSCTDSIQALVRLEMDTKLAQMKVEEDWNDQWISLLEEFSEVSTSTIMLRELLKASQYELVHTVSMNQLDLSNDPSLMLDLVRHLNETTKDQTNLLFLSVMNLSANETNPNDQLDAYFELLRSPNHAAQSLSMIITGNYIMSEEKQRLIASRIDDVNRLVAILESFCELEQYEYLQAIHLLKKLIGNESFRTKFSATADSMFSAIVDQLYQRRVYETKHKFALKLALEFYTKYVKFMKDEQTNDLIESITRWKQNGCKDEEINSGLQSIIFSIIQQKDDTSLSHLAFEGFESQQGFQRQLDLNNFSEKVKIVGILLARDLNTRKASWFEAVFNEMKETIDLLHQQPDLKEDPRLRVIDNNYRYICAKIAES